MTTDNNNEAVLDTAEDNLAPETATEDQDENICSTANPRRFSDNDNNLVLDWETVPAQAQDLNNNDSGNDNGHLEPEVEPAPNPAPTATESQSGNSNQPNLN